MIGQQEIRDMQAFATDVRIHTIRQIAKRGFGHIGGSMSIADLLSTLYCKDLRYNPKDPNMESRDWLVCSKGHAGPALYAALALKGFFPMEWLDTLNQPGTNLPSHCDHRRTPGIDMTTGSLGQGISLAMGIALSHQRKGRDNTIFCIVGDGECQEGQVWEAVMFAAQHKLNRFVLFVDYNREQLDGPLSQIIDLEGFEEKFKAFHWNTLQVDGHDYAQIHDAIALARQSQTAPTVILLNTVKGKGCCFAEGKFNHHINVSEKEADEAIACLKAQREGGEQTT